ncbi:MAG: hypothetical protein K9L59_10100 [Desulfobacterales bacterium]|nr:hypothetical protein [Desulfobacterales bacterium]
MEKEQMDVVIHLAASLGHLVKDDPALFEEACAIVEEHFRMLGILDRYSFPSTPAPPGTWGTC